MKNLSVLRNKIVLLFIAMISGINAFAQDASSASRTSTTSTSTSTAPNVPADWYMMPWVWVVGGVIVLLILIALLRSGSGNSRVDVQKTTITRTDEISTDV